ncbi:cell adhesion molecule-related/down-regulated by oncogenes-like [Haliotis rufescens]|uniref:cell adhesion molecule-related/down-regulated by oncogenes-like n=1 Tax=Haliotis rufescens TaxID=6454 RepID=UPI00201F9FB8|nr:cell adhesion molecule-related/down-regulated by oncogenes-like [Haliotis rufescens]XP_048246085.1 cell adhesion molecule-related/down-regulated by oncogenes-like [Haliotis rufescens]XP_048246086.1 cell adhesion molecule-related/down-regulated by oncogenes-like [Haliotis rufescens]
MRKCCTELYALGSAICLLLASCLSLARGGAVPAFLREPKTSVISHHAPVTIYCEVTPPNATVKWLFNSKLLKQEDHNGLEFRGDNLYFNNFEYSSNEGIYHCVASAVAGSIISIPLVVLRPPEVGSFPVKPVLAITAAESGMVVIPCSSPVDVPNPPKVYLEDSSGTRLGNSTDVFTVLPSGSVLIKNVQQSHSGRYQCKMSKHVTALQDIDLTVQAQAAGSETSIVDTSRVKIFPWIGESVLLECPTSSTGTPSVTWDKYGGTLPQDRTVVENGNLRIKDVKIEDAGTYICKGTSEEPSRIIAMDVQESVTAKAQRLVITVNAGERAELRCNVTGRPEPKVMWYYNAKPVPKTTGISNGAMVLVITKVVPSRAGFYQCQALNNASSASAVMKLEVKGQGLDPTGNTDETTIGVTESDQAGTNETTSENLKVNGDIKVPKRNRPNKNGGRKNRKKGKKNKRKRKKKKKKRKKGKAKLVPPSQPHVDQLSDTSVKLNWTVPQNDGLPIVFFRVQYKEVAPNKASWHTDDHDIDKDTTMYEVSNLKPGGIYKFRIAAVYSNNDNEVGQNSHRFFMKVAPAGKAHPPVDRPTIVEAMPLHNEEQGKDVFGIGIKWQYILTESSPIEGFFIFYKPYDSKDQWKKITILETKVRGHVLGYLKPDTEYSIRMLCFNSAGNSDSSNTVVKRTLALTKPPKAFPVEPVTDKANTRNMPSPDKPRVEEPRNPTHRGDGIDTEKTSTQSSSETLYMVLGIVLGVMLLLLFVFIVMCWWKQRQQRRMMAMNGVIHSKYQDQAQRIYSESMRKKYMNGYPLNGLNGLVANGHGPHGNSNHNNKMNINVNPMSEVECQMINSQAGKGSVPNHTLVPNGSIPHYSGPHSTSDNNFNSINTAKSVDDISPDQPLLDQNGGTRNGEKQLHDPAVLYRLGQRSSSLQHVPPQGHGHSSNEADMSGAETNSQKSPRMHVPGGVDCFLPNDRQLRTFDGGTTPNIFSARNTMDSLSPSDHISGNHGKHKRRRKRPHSREHTTKDQATNTDLSSNEGTIEFTTFNKSPSLSSEKSQSFTNCATQCTDYSHMNGAL